MSIAAGEGIAASLAVEFAGMRFQNPVFSASGCFGWGDEYARFWDLRRLGALVGKAVTPQPRLGNPSVRIAETPAGMLNAIGLQNPGPEVFLEKILPRVRELGIPIWVNVSAFSLQEYVDLCGLLSTAPGVSAIELNLSCPNVGRGRAEFCVDPEAVSETVSACRPVCKCALVPKLSPNTTDIAALASAAEASGADAVSLINTLIGMAIDVEKRRPVLGNRTGGLSGPAVKPVALRMVYEVAGAVSIPVVGIGGIACWRDALEFLMAGASAVQVGTANFINPLAIPQIVEGLETWLREHQIADIREIIGAARAG
ncbi:MAG: dihydroorotate dehydrogenase [Armatimonadetes bacterium]|nr:dihydroorotate dehydrogenase [Armatimonadota bacterium]